MEYNQLWDRTEPLEWNGINQYSQNGQSNETAHNPVVRKHGFEWYGKENQQCHRTTAVQRCNGSHNFHQKRRIIEQLQMVLDTYLIASAGNTTKTEPAIGTLGTSSQIKQLVHKQ